MVTTLVLLLLSACVASLILIQDLLRRCLDVLERIEKQGK
jgi:hypothetical protein